MRTSIETRNGKLVTVIRHDFAEREAWVREQLAMGMPVVVADKDGCPRVLRECSIPGGTVSPAYYAYDGGYYFAEDIAHVVTVLPALPARATAACIPLVCHYIACGLNLVLQVQDGRRESRLITKLPEIFDYMTDGMDQYRDFFTHAVDALGYIHKIAIEGGE